MIILTLTDHNKIGKIVRLINIEKKLRNRENIFLQRFHRIFVKKIKKLDQNYFHPRVVEIVNNKRFIDFEKIKLSESHYPFFKLFKEILYGKIKNRPDS